MVAFLVMTVQIITLFCRFGGTSSREAAPFFSKRRNKLMTLHGVPFSYFTKIHLNVILPSVLMCGYNVLSPLPQLHTPSVCHYFCVCIYI